MTEGVRRRAARRVEDRSVGLVRALEERVGFASFARSFLDHMFPDHWSFFLGELALYLFVVLVATGIFLAFYFDPSLHTTTYHGTYAQLRGTKVSYAYQSALNISFDVRFGIVVRQMHHWAADLFIGAIAAHMCRIFFTSAFRKPRDINWIVGVTLLFAAIVNGYLGYSMPDDLMSGTGVRIGFSIVESIPIVGSYLAFFIFNGNFPGRDAYVYRMYIAHVFIIPLIIAGLIGIHLFLIYRQEHTQFPKKHRNERRIVGSPLWPSFLFKTTGLMFMVGAVVTFLGAVAQINPIWLYGHYDPYKVSYASQPDWYMGWIEGALRITPGSELRVAGHTVPWSVFLPGVVLPIFTYMLFLAWPWIERRVTKDRAMHQQVTRPRDRPVHTAIGMGVLGFYLFLLWAGADDVMAQFFGVSLEEIVWFYRIGGWVIPVFVGWVTYKICKGLQRRSEAGIRGSPVTLSLDGDGGYTVVAARPIGEEELEPLPIERTEVLDEPRAATEHGGS